MEMIEKQILACTLRTTPIKPFNIFLILLLIDFTKCVYKLIALNIANVLFRAVF